LTHNQIRGHILQEKPVLIAYASLTGGAQQIAEELERLFKAGGIASQARNLNAVQDLLPYRAVIVGSTIRQEGWLLPEAVQFVAKFQPQLKTLPVFYYLVAMTMHQDTPPTTPRPLCTTCLRCAT
jgi:menaquinone-dependent protoporphyrinogen IX oxidase